jgi:4-hydroxythreonine-4-phosphate dehydrogenase
MGNMRPNYRNNRPQDRERRVSVGISHGDINSISYEIILKTLQDSRILDIMNPIVYGSSKVASYHKKNLNINEFNFNVVRKIEEVSPKKANLVNIVEEEVKIELGKQTKVAGELAYKSLEAVTQDLEDRKINVMVTAPISKQNIQSDDFHFPGHTEYLANRFKSEDQLMIMVNNNLRIGMITGHLPLKEISENLSVDLIMKKINIMNDSLIRDFQIRKPKIAVLSLNPHAGDNGLLGKEEEEVIIPAIEEAKKQGILAMGPFPADGFFGSSSFNNFDGVLAMYHDQGMIAFKTISFDSGVNYTAGLPVVRTSPAHGTAFELAGKNMASPDSFRAALFLAVDIYNNRRLHDSINRRPLRPQKLVDDGIVDELPEDASNNNDVTDGLHA